MDPCNKNMSMSWGEILISPFFIMLQEEASLWVKTPFTFHGVYF